MLFVEKTTDVLYLPYKINWDGINQTLTKMTSQAFTYIHKHTGNSFKK